MGMTAFATGEGITAAVGAAADTTAGALDGVVAGAGQVAGVTEKLWDPRTCTPPHASSTTATGASTRADRNGMATLQQTAPPRRRDLDPFRAQYTHSCATLYLTHLA